jgi:hypothetical protein
MPKVAVKAWAVLTLAQILLSSLAWSFALPEPQAFLGWTVQLEEKTGAPSPFTCPDRRLFPTHPQMSLKIYHRYQYARYDHFRLPANSPACMIRGMVRNSRGEFPCFRPDSLRYALVSDTYEDSCGGLYRAYFEALFWKRKERMNTLFSGGRSTRKKEGSLFEEFASGTVPVGPGEALFLSPLFPGDEALIRAEQENARLQGYHRDGLLWYVPSQL